MQIAADDAETPRRHKTAVGHHWKTMVNVGALIPMVAAVHYFTHASVWVQIEMSSMFFGMLAWFLCLLRGAKK